MLVLTRKVGEEITIGDNIRLSVTQINGRRVKLGIIAPQQISIHRQQVAIAGDDESILPITGLPQIDIAAQS